MKKLKRFYKKPRIGKVNLVPEEAVLTFCKVEFSGKTAKCNGPGGTCDNNIYGS